MSPLRKRLIFLVLIISLILSFLQVLDVNFGVDLPISFHPRKYPILRFIVPISFILVLIIAKWKAKSTD